MLTVLHVLAHGDGKQFEYVLIVIARCPVMPTGLGAQQTALLTTKLLTK